ncbi:MAG: 2-C-methyl-D-erythritol 4-phosphate cytidylyltransferase [Oscillospiraceae bacterium]|jgi:2-C-methyl-D-erythritol 4-phosphate cytidylyltransferase|nr:2-C-methyl-D-erythritol 4-phosphate cytidylyltransferase [Oscillospiraceae bacterium]
MIFGAIVAGGLGLRMGISEFPKQFMNLGDKPILIHTLEKFLLCRQFDCICIGIHKDWKLYASDILLKFNITDERVMIVKGGDDRNLTIMNIIKFLEEKFGIIEEHIIVTHDAVRPFVTLKIIEENIAAAKKFGACNTVVCSHDTIIRSSEDKKIIEEIPNRNFMFLGQTPQSFKMSKLKIFYNDLNQEDKNSLTDACKIFILRGHPVHIVMGEFSNIKITTVNDYKIAKTLLNV